MPYKSSVRFLIPIQYRRGGGSLASATYAGAFDGDRNTTCDAYGTISDISITGLDGGGVCKYLFVDTHSTSFTSGSYFVQINGSLASLASPYFYEEYGYTGQFTRAGSLIRRYTGSGSRSVLISINNSTATTGVKLNVSSVSGANPLVTGLIFSEDYSLPLYDQGYSVSVGFPAKDNRTPTGFLSHDISFAKSIQAIETVSFTWSGLTGSQAYICTEIVKAFGGNIRRPFCIVVINDDNTLGDIWHLLIAEDTVTLPDNEKGEYTFSFSANILNISY